MFLKESDETVTPYEIVIYFLHFVPFYTYRYSLLRIPITIIYVHINFIIFQNNTFIYHSFFIYLLIKFKLIILHYITI